MGRWMICAMLKRRCFYDYYQTDGRWFSVAARKPQFSGSVRRHRPPEPPPRRQPEIKWAPARDRDGVQETRLAELAVSAVLMPACGAAAASEVLEHPQL